MPTPFGQVPDPAAYTPCTGPLATLVPTVAAPATAPPPVDHPMLANRVFGDDQVAALAAPLDASHVKTRSSYSYLPGWHVINEANRIFGFDGWHREIIQVQCVVDCERTIGRDSRPGWGVTYLARVRITVIADGEKVIRDGSGAGNGIDADRGIAHESAIKEAETDAMKRALITFGNPFGLALYDKEQRQVTSSMHPGWEPPPGQWPHSPTPTPFL